MPEVIQQYISQFHDKSGSAYAVTAYGEPTTNGTWAGWLEFHPIDKTKPVMCTERETTQPDRSALEYWASGLEPLYFEGAFARARTK